MRLFAAHEPAGRFSRSLAQEPSGSAPPPMWRVLCAVCDARMKRAAIKLAQAQRDVHRACTAQRCAEAEFERLEARAGELEGEWHRAWRHREAQGRDIHDARAACSRLEIELAKQAEHARACAQVTVRTREVFSQARERYCAASRKNETFGLLLQRLEEAGREP